MDRTWARKLDIHFSGGDTHVRVCADHHDCRVGGKRADKGGEGAVANAHGRVGGKRADKGGEGAVANAHGERLTLAAAARQLELLDDVGDLLEAVHVVVLLAAALRYDEKRHALKQNNLADMV
jgi:hypothetical protein